MDVFRLKQLEDNPPDIMLSHDWPRGVTDFGDVDRLLRFKKHFRDEIVITIRLRSLIGPSGGEVWPSRGVVWPSGGVVWTVRCPSGVVGPGWPICCSWWPSWQ